MKTDCCGCGCSGCLFWMVIFAALVLGSCGSVHAKLTVSKSKDNVKSLQKVEQKCNVSNSAGQAISSHSR